MLEITNIPAFEDNYIWLLHDNTNATVIDPGDSKPVLEFLESKALTLDTILITHHHHDHIDGVNDLIKRYKTKVYTPAKEHFEFESIQAKDKDIIEIPSLNVKFSVLDIPGHTLGHIAYYGSNLLFCGDTLFGAGCGRLFEGTYEQLYNSLSLLAKLPDNTQVYCAHEYTEKNLNFALFLEPENTEVVERLSQVKELRLSGKATLPSNLALEKKTNPFLRCNNEQIRIAAGENTTDPIAVFTAIRKMRNYF